MTARHPTVSIVCTNYNKGEWIRDAIESFLAQKPKFDYEVIIIDDASTDRSPEIIAEYATKYPGKIRAFYNKKNLGITKTWIKVCEEARGKYIARCDGDDYWIDGKKLQKQVDLLEKTSNSLWCSTDYNIATPEGKVTHVSAFENGVVDRSSSYAQMLATRGFTMSSTWLLDSSLMKEVNADIDSSAVDDTFSIQLELFNRTRLSYLPEATTVFRLNDGSDSRPTDIEKIRSRNERLLKTQLEYIEKYKDIDYEEIIKILLAKSMQYEMWAIERLHIIEDHRDHIKQQETHIQDLEQTIQCITRSPSYKIGRSISQPLKTTKAVLKKANEKHQKTS